MSTEYTKVTGVEAGDLLWIEVTREDQFLDFMIPCEVVSIMDDCYEVCISFANNTITFVPKDEVFRKVYR